MRGGIWFMASAVAVLSMVSIGAGDVDPNGQYTCNGNFTWKHGSEVQKGTHTGKMTCNNLKFYGVTTASTGAKATSRFTLSHKPSPRINSGRTLTGTITVQDQDSTVYEVFQGTANFKIASNEHMTYGAVVKARVNSGADAGATLGISYRGSK